MEYIQKALSNYTIGVLCLSRDEVYIKFINIRQSPAEHSWVSAVFSGQSGASTITVLSLADTPAPHEAEQGDHSDQSDSTHVTEADMYMA